MKVQRTSLSDVLLLQPARYTDGRGYLREFFCHNRFVEATRQPFSCIQVNQSSSQKNVLRGLHFQKPPHAQSKLVQVILGEILDVVVDLRKGSPSYGRHLAVPLSADLEQVIFIPKGFAHGFLVLSKKALVQYAIDVPYASNWEGGIRYDDPHVGVAWPGKKEDFILSEKDLKLNNFSEASNIFTH